MEVLVVNSSLRVGGAESMSVALANALARAGQNVSFAAAGGPLRDNLVDVVSYVWTANANDAPLRAAGELARHMRRRGTQIVHSHGGMCAVAASLACRRVRPRPARVLTHHSRIFRRAPRAISAFAMKRVSDRFVAISRAKKEALLSSGIAPERVSLIPNFIDVSSVETRLQAVDGAKTRSALDLPGDAAVACIAGRVLVAKGFDRFVRIVERAAAKLDRPLIGLAIGDGPALAEIQNDAERRGAPVRFLGYQPDVLPYMAVSDIALFPSSHPEVLPMFLIEACAARLPVVCSGVPGNLDVVGRDGVARVIDGSDEDWAEAVIELIRNPATRRRMAEAGLEIARTRFDERSVVSDVIALYEELLA